MPALDDYQRIMEWMDLERIRTRPQPAANPDPVTTNIIDDGYKYYEYDVTNHNYIKKFPKPTKPDTPPIWPDLPPELTQCLTDDQKLRMIIKDHVDLSKNAVLMYERIMRTLDCFKQPDVETTDEEAW